MYSQALINAVAEEWSARAALAPLVAPQFVACVRCADSDLLAETIEGDHARVHALVTSVEEILDGAIDEYVNEADPMADQGAWERRLESVDSYRASLRSQARGIVVAAIARVQATERTAS